jgi:hypothetical protein
LKGANLKDQEKKYAQKFEYTDMGCDFCGKPYRNFYKTLFGTLTMKTIIVEQHPGNDKKITNAIFFVVNLNRWMLCKIEEPIMIKKISHSINTCIYLHLV